MNITQTIPARRLENARKQAAAAYRKKVRVFTLFITFTRIIMLGLMGGILYTAVTKKPGMSMALLAAAFVNAFVTALASFSIKKLLPLKSVAVGVCLTPADQKCRITLEGRALSANGAMIPLGKTSRAYLTGRYIAAADSTGHFMVLAADATTVNSLAAACPVYVIDKNGSLLTLEKSKKRI